MGSVNQHISMSISEANFSTQYLMLDYLMLFSGSLVGLDIEKWVPTKKSLGSADIEVKTGNNLLNTIMLHSWKSELKLNGSIQTKQRSM